MFGWNLGGIQPGKSLETCLSINIKGDRKFESPKFSLLFYSRNSLLYLNYSCRVLNHCNQPQRRALQPLTKYLTTLNLNRAENN